MNKEVVVKSLKSIIYAGTLVIGISLFGNDVGAEETNAQDVQAESNVVTQQVEPKDVANATIQSNENSQVQANVTSTTNENSASGENNQEKITSTSSSEQSIIPKNPPVKTGNPAGKDDNIKSEKKGSLISIGLGGSLLQPIIGDVKIDIIGGKKVETKDGSTLTTGGVVQADLKDSGLLGDTHLGVIEGTKIKTDDYEYTHGAVADLDVKKSVVGDAHVGVIEGEKVETDEYTWKHGGIAIVDTKNTPVLGDVHAGIGEFEDFEAKQPAAPNQPAEPKDPEQPGNP
ncbi:glycosyl hydrolase family 5, partial [Parageobacillus thermoglucosidasius]